MNVKLIKDDTAKRVSLKLISSCDRIDIAVAWAAKNTVVDALVLNESKLRQATSRSSPGANSMPQSNRTNSAPGAASIAATIELSL